MNAYHLINALDEKEPRVSDRSHVLVQLPNGDFAHIDRVVIMNDQIVIETTLDSRDITL